MIALIILYQKIIASQCVIYIKLEKGRKGQKGGGVEKMLKILEVKMQFYTSVDTNEPFKVFKV